MIHFEQVPHVTDFWGVVIPGWIAAVGGLASAGVAIWALVSSRKNRLGLETIKAVNNLEQQSPALSGNAEYSGSGTMTAVGHPHFVTWEIKSGRRGQYKLVNSSASDSAYLDALEVFDGDGADSPLRDLAPKIRVQPGASVPFFINESLLSSALTAVQVTWHEGDGPQTSTILFV